MRAGLAVLVMSGLLAALSGCAGGPSYAPQASDSTIGYSDEQLSAERYRVTFSGDIDDSREQVEDYLLRRAAEVTLAAGFTHFVIDKQNTEMRVQHRSAYEQSDHPLGWGPQVSSLPTNLRMALRSSWQSHLILPRSLPDTRRYIAISEIVLLSGEALARNPNAISAREVLDRPARPRA